MTRQCPTTPSPNNALERITDTALNQTFTARGTAMPLRNSAMRCLHGTLPYIAFTEPNIGMPHLAKGVLNRALPARRLARLNLGVTQQNGAKTSHSCTKHYLDSTELRITEAGHDGGMLYPDGTKPSYASTMLRTTSPTLR